MLTGLEIPRLEEFEKEMLRQIGRKYSYGRGEVIFSAGDPADIIYLLESGTARIYRLAGDRRQVTVGSLRGAGELMGLAEALAGVKRTCHACSLEPLNLILVKYEDFQNLLLKAPLLSIKVARMLAYRMRDAESSIRDMVALMAPERLACTLLKISRSHGVMTGDGLKINLRLTHGDLASMIGASRQTVTSMITVLKQENIIVQEGREYKIKDPVKLKRRLN
ncbi:cAMP-binding protein [Desulfocucumis palustris]|uniref:cAMP-binding protein n=1 Tax=Desulfocucumis palustris TaxID=1898651 RepID=A0A2L2XGG0_9FIRM|nr:Crp/Fnr family transcriptional regulator [Desulfocucumis palustris]GBF35318.1 cAMP-binding protein [Desulfocucumis palustris]